jgi:hypothetical protein
MNKRVFFLGSGFSKLAGFPLMPDFYEFLETHVNKMNGLKSEFDKIGFSICKEKLEKLGLGNTSFSNGFSFLRSLTQFNDNSELNTLDRLNLHQAMMVVAKAFILKQEEAKKQIEEDIPDFSPYIKFYKLLSEQDTIVSINYDLLSELFLWQMNKWSFLDGYGFNISLEQLGISYPKDKAKHSKIKIHKIHGSLNWIPVEGNGISLRDTAFLFDVEGSNLPPSHSGNLWNVIKAINFSKAIVFPLYKLTFALLKIEKSSITGSKRRL